MSSSPEKMEDLYHVSPVDALMSPQNRICFELSEFLKVAAVQFCSEKLWNVFLALIPFVLFHCYMFSSLCQSCWFHVSDTPVNCVVSLCCFLSHPSSFTKSLPCPLPRLDNMSSLLSLSSSSVAFKKNYVTVGKLNQIYGMPKVESSPTSPLRQPLQSGAVDSAFSCLPSAHGSSPPLSAEVCFSFLPSFCLFTQKLLFQSMFNI